MASKIEAMYERSHLRVKVEPRSTSRLMSTLYTNLTAILFTRLKFTCVNVRSEKRVSGINLLTGRLRNLLRTTDLLFDGFLT